MGVDKKYDTFASEKYTLYRVKMKNNPYNRIIPRFFAFFWLFAIFFQLFFANRLAGEMKFNTSPDKVTLNQGFFFGRVYSFEKKRQ